LLQRARNCMTAFGAGGGGRQAVEVVAAVGAETAALARGTAENCQQAYKHNRKRTGHDGVEGEINKQASPHWDEREAALSDSNPPSVKCRSHAESRGPRVAHTPGIEHGSAVLGARIRTWCRLQMM